MKLAVSLSLLLGANILFANDSLITKAKNAGLEPIPSSKSELMKLIDDKLRTLDATTYGQYLNFEQDKLIDSF